MSNTTTNNDMDVSPRTYPCEHPGCEAGFNTKQALTMHTVRMHTHRDLASKRSGEATKRRWSELPKRIPKSKTKAYTRQKYREYRDRCYAKGLSAQGKPFASSGHMKQFRRVTKANTRHYAWPLMEPEKTPQATATAIKFCPHCGHNLEKHLSV